MIALCSPATRPADTDRVAYWRGWRPPEPEDDEDLRRTRAAASVGPAFADLVEIYAEATAAVLVAAGRVDAAGLVSTQGYVLTVADLLSTLTVEAAVHHLDLVAHLERPGPAAGPLAEVRGVLEGLLGRSLPAGRDDGTAPPRHRTRAADRRRPRRAG